MDRKGWEVERLSLMTENAQVKEHLVDAQLKITQAAREIESLKALLDKKHVELETTTKQMQRTSIRMRELEREEAENMGSGMCVQYLKPARCACSLSAAAVLLLVFCLLARMQQGLARHGVSHSVLAVQGGARARASHAT